MAKNRKAAPVTNGNTPPKTESIKKDSYLTSQKKWLLQALILSVASFVALKLCFPLPDMDLDGVNYVSWAYHDIKLGYRPLGYPHFLQMLHKVWPSVYAVAATQYSVYVASLAFAFFSVDYLFGIPTRFKQLITVLTFVNPLLIFQANTISSDSLFCSLSIMFLTLCIWFAKRADWRLFIPLAAVLYFCLEIRFTALFYPALIFLAILLSRIKLVPKFLYAGAVTLGLMLFVQKHEDIAYDQTKTAVFSGFSGWQIANNALYCYKKTDIKTSDFPTTETQRIDSMTKLLIDSVTVPPGEVGDVFLWSNRSPIKLYAQYHSILNKVQFFHAWIRVSDDVKQFGWLIVKKYPVQFAKYYLWPNFKRFWYPEASPLDNYNSANAKLPREVGTWFGWQPAELTCRFPTLQKKIIPLYPAINVVLNLFNIVVLLFFFIKAIPARKKISHKVWILFFVWGGYYFSFMAFSVFASAIYLRFLDTVFALSFAFTAILLNEALKKRTDENLAEAAIEAETEKKTIKHTQKVASATKL